MIMALARLVFTPYDTSTEDGARKLFLEYPHKNYQLQTMGIAKESMAAYLEKTLREPGVQTICLRDNGSLVGLVALQFLPWMSEHFGMRMYAVRHLLARSDNRLVCTRLLRFVIEELVDVDFLDCRVAVDDIHSAHALEVCGFRYVGTEIFLGQKLQGPAEADVPNDVEVGPCKAFDCEEVLDIVEETHVHNRFVYDPLITERAARSLFRRLVEKCFDRSQFRVLVARSRNRVHGFLVSKMNSGFQDAVGVRTGSLDFIGVRPDMRKNGVGAALNRVALAAMVRDGVSYVGVRTLANNYPALRNCLTTGFSVTSSSLHFHRWVRRPRPALKKRYSESSGDSFRVSGDSSTRWVAG
jgi:ribosomal protein S18 acetylase RimI-like enzyme